MSLLRLVAPTVIQESLDAFLARFDEDGTNEHTASHFCSKILGSLFFFFHYISYQVLGFKYLLTCMCLGCWKCVWVKLPVIF